MIYQDKGRTNEVKTEIKQVEEKKPQKNNTEKNENAEYVISVL